MARKGYGRPGAGGEGGGGGSGVASASVGFPASRRHASFVVNIFFFIFALLFSLVFWFFVVWYIILEEAGVCRGRS